MAPDRQSIRGRLNYKAIAAPALENFPHDGVDLEGSF